MSDILRDFDKKNEFPKVKLNLTKFDFSHLTEAVKNMNTAFDNIAKDIRDRQDNAMAMEFTKRISELLKKNGVVPKLTEYKNTSSTFDKIGEEYGVSIDELDFSEHDKAFEDKIELLNRNLNLQKDKRCEVETERNYLAERFNQLKGENDELKQRIAELESRESVIEVRVPASPIEIATHLINNTCTINELKMIAEHINVYCNGGNWLDSHTTHFQAEIGT